MKSCGTQTPPETEEVMLTNMLKLSFTLFYTDLEHDLKYPIQKIEQLNMKKTK